MTTDYDAPRRSESDEADESLPGLPGRNEALTAVIDVDESDQVDSFELPGADLFGEEFTVRVIPKQLDEFTCSSCFLVYHRNRMAKRVGDRVFCHDCV